MIYFIDVEGLIFAYETEEDFQEYGKTDMERVVGEALHEHLQINAPHILGEELINVGD